MRSIGIPDIHTFREAVYVSLPASLFFRFYESS
jgi:hypothetical protein